jgi:hypothetical protein
MLKYIISDTHVNSFQNFLHSLVAQQDSTVTVDCMYVHSRVFKGLEPRLHDLVLSIGENKILSLKGIASLKLLQDIVLMISISSTV